VAFPVAMAYTLATFGSIFGGWLPMFFIKKNWPVFKARKTSMMIYAVAVVPVVFAQYLGSMHMWLAVFIIGFAMAAHQAWSANIFTTVSDMFPKKSTASVTGIGGMFGALGGILVSKSAGALFDSYKYAGIAKSWVEAKAAGLANYVSQIQGMKLLDKKNHAIDLSKVELRSLGNEISAQLQSIDSVAFQKLKVIQTPIVNSNLSTSYFIMFLICGTAYLLAWLIMHYLVPKMKRVEYGN
jgi:ACS family hexuronate transporter-like MFS transporter